MEDRIESNKRGLEWISCASLELSVYLRVASKEKGVFVYIISFGLLDQ